MVKAIWENLFRQDKKQNELITILRENYIFSTLHANELWFLKDMVHVRNYRTGEAIFRSGEIGSGMYIIIRGTIDVSAQDILVTRLTTGDFFGEISLVEETNRRSATAMSMDDSTLIGFFRPDLLEIVSRSPVTGNKILLRLGEVLGRRLRETVDQMSQLKREIK